MGHEAPLIAWEDRNILCEGYGKGNRREEGQFVVVIISGFLE
jgi:hypothetical protein